MWMRICFLHIAECTYVCEGGNLGDRPTLYWKLGLGTTSTCGSPEYRDRVPTVPDVSHYLNSAFDVHSGRAYCIRSRRNRSTAPSGVSEPAQDVLRRLGLRIGLRHVTVQRAANERPAAWGRERGVP